MKHKYVKEIQLEDEELLIVQNCKIIFRPKHDLVLFVNNGIVVRKYSFLEYIEQINKLKNERRN